MNENGPHTPPGQYRDERDSGALRCAECNWKGGKHAAFCRHATSADRLRDFSFAWPPTHEEAQHSAAYGNCPACCAPPAEPCRPWCPDRIERAKAAYGDGPARTALGDGDVVGSASPNCTACGRHHGYGECPTNYVKWAERLEVAAVKGPPDEVFRTQDELEAIWRAANRPGRVVHDLDKAFGVEVPGNPKDAAGDKKLAVDIIPWGAILACEPVFKHGADKYGPLNWREEGQKIGRRAYLNAALRHLFADLEGETLDPDSGEMHIKHAIAGLSILLDGILVGNCLDNRRLPGQAGTVIQLGGANMRGDQAA